MSAPPNPLPYPIGKVRVRVRVRVREASEGGIDKRQMPSRYRRNGV